MPHKSKEKQQQTVRIETNASYMDTGSTKLRNAPDLDGKLDYPIMKHAARIPVVTQLKRPDEASVIKAHKEVGLKLSSGSILHPKRVSRAVEKYNKQKDLLELSQHEYDVRDESKEMMVDSLSEMDLSSLMYEDSKKSADENLFDHYAELRRDFVYIKAYEESVENNKDMDDEERAKHKARIRTLADIRTYYEVIEALMLNKYYAYLPRAEMLKLGEDTLMVRLNKLYEEEPDRRNIQLIDFYQNLLRLKRLGIKDAKDIKEREAAYLKEFQGEPEGYVRDAAVESKKLVDTYTRFLKNLEKKRGFLTEEDKKKRRYQFFSVCAADLKVYRNTITAMRTEDSNKLIEDFNEYNFYHEQTEFENDFTDQTIEGVLNENPDAKMLEKRDKPPKGIELSAKQKEGVRIIQTFLLRRSSQDADVSESFVSSLLQAPPEQQLTVFYLVESGRQSKGMKADFYTALKDYTPDPDVFRKKVKKHFWGGTNWNVISDAVQAAKGLGEEIKIHAELSVKAEEAETALRAVERDPAKYKEQGKNAMDAITFHAAALRQLYALAGMNEDMPPDLAEDRKLRERMYSEYKQIGVLAKKLGDIIKDHPDILAKIDKKDTGKEKSEIKEEKKESKTARAIEGAAGVNKYFAPSRLIEIGASGLASDMDDIAKAFVEGNIYYNLTKGSLLNLSSVISIVDSIYGLFMLSGQKNMTMAEGYVKYTGRINGLILNMDWTGAGVLGTLKNFDVIDSTATEVVTAGTVLTGVSIAGSIVSMTADAVQLGRMISNGKDLKQAHEKLKRRTGDRQKNAGEKRLERYLKHQERETDRQKLSAEVNLIKDTASTAAMVMSATGVLAPIAAAIKVTSGVTGVLHNFFFDRSWKKDNIRQTVDEYLGVKELVSGLKDNYNINVRGMSDIALEKQVRREALGKLGFTSDKQCYRHICRQFAEMLYTKLFCGECESRDEWDMYNSALAGLGMSKVVYRNDFGDKPQPTVQAIFARMYA